jgi:hypothetical protein
MPQSPIPDSNPVYVLFDLYHLSKPPSQFFLVPIGTYYNTLLTGGKTKDMPAGKRKDKRTA